MTHHIYIDDTVVIRRRFEIPERCPRCKTKYGLGENVLKSQALRPREETIQLTTVLTGETKREVVSVRELSQFGSIPRLILDIRCNSCNYTLAAAHSRMYVLEEMDRLMAFKLRGLLYDSNAADPTVRQKCFNETQGYLGECLACNIEAEIGTEEVPHPIDPRAHICVLKVKHELDK